MTLNQAYELIFPPKKPRRRMPEPKKMSFRDFVSSKSKLIRPAEKPFGKKQKKLRVP